MKKLNTEIADLPRNKLSEIANSRGRKLTQSIYVAFKYSLPNHRNHRIFAIKNGRRTNSKRIAARRDGGKKLLRLCHFYRRTRYPAPGDWLAKLFWSVFNVRLQRFHPVSFHPLESSLSSSSLYVNHTKASRHSLQRIFLTNFIWRDDGRFFFSFFFFKFCEKNLDKREQTCSMNWNKKNGKKGNKNFRTIWSWIYIPLAVENTSINV